MDKHLLIGFVISISVLTQFITALLAVRLIRVTGNRVSWGLISLSIFFMAIRRSISLFQFIAGDSRSASNLSFEIVGLIISFLMLGGVILISPLFKSMADEIVRRKRAEEALRESEKKLNSVASNLAEGLLVVDEGGRIVFMNPEAERLLGWNAEELNRKGVHSTIHFQKADDTPLPIEECPIHNVAITGERFFSADEVFVRRDGTVFPVSIICSPVIEDGRVVASVTAFRDITERKRLEQELMKVRNLESIGLLARGIAHDFNNLLQGMLGNIHVAKLHMRPADKAYRYLEAAENARSLAKDLTGQLLTFAKGGLPVKKPVRIEGFLREWVTLALRGSNLTAEFDLNEMDRAVEIDEVQMRRVIENLVINAKESMPKGGTLGVSSRVISVSKEDGLPLREGDYVKISIKDQGAGIPEKNIPRIFDPYFSTKNIGNQKGMGLGLATCYSTMKNHGGFITVESKEAQGTTFHIYLPVAGMKVSQKRVTTSAATSASRKKRVLVMDDEKIVTAVAEIFLGELGYEAAVANEGSKAVELYRDAAMTGNPFDAVILDLVVPGGMGGVETLLRLLEIDAHVKAIVMSGYSNEQIITDFKRKGFLGALTKPYDIEELSAVLLKVCG